MFFNVGGLSEKKPIKDYYDMIIIGGGPAGLTAAIYAVQGGITPLIIEKALNGGQMNLTDYIENYPGIKSILGSELGEKMGEHARGFGVEFKYTDVINIKDNEGMKTVYTSEGISIKTKVIILATGANPKRLGAKGETEFTGKGVSYCASCDGHFFKDGKVAVIGGGNTAVQEALYLSKIAKEVYIIHRRDKLRADKIYQDRALKVQNIKYIWNSGVEEIIGTTKVESLKIKNFESNETIEDKFDGVFVFIGYSPATELVKGIVELDEAGYIKTDENLETNVKGIYAVGDVREKELRQIVTAVADGAIASSHAVRNYFD